MASRYEKVYPEGNLLKKHKPLLSDQISILVNERKKRAKSPTEETKQYSRLIINLSDIVSCRF